MNYKKEKIHLFPKTAGKSGSGGGGVNLIPPCGVLRNVFSKGKVGTWFCISFNIILRHIFLKNSIEFSQVIQKM